MAERVLCEESLGVSIDGQGDRTLLVLKNGTTIRFWVDTFHLEEALKGGAVQVSVHGGHCMVEVVGDQVHIELATDAEEARACAFPRQLLADSLAMVRLGSGPNVAPLPPE